MPWSRRAHPEATSSPHTPPSPSRSLWTRERSRTLLRRPRRARPGPRRGDAAGARPHPERIKRARRWAGPSAPAGRPASAAPSVPISRSRAPTARTPAPSLCGTAVEGQPRVTMPRGHHVGSDSALRLSDKPVRRARRARLRVHGADGETVGRGRRRQVVAFRGVRGVGDGVGDVEPADPQREGVDTVVPAGDVAGGGVAGEAGAASTVRWSDAADVEFDPFGRGRADPRGDDRVAVAVEPAQQNIWQLRQPGGGAVGSGILARRPGAVPRADWATAVPVLYGNPVDEHLGNVVLSRRYPTDLPDRPGAQPRPGRR